MSKLYKDRKLSKKEKLDIETMQYFLPTKGRIYPNDKKKMADLSSQGITPKNQTSGFVLLKWGKTYRDLQITEYKRDISLGLITKGEILDSMPENLRDWLWKKIQHVPYDTDGTTTKMLVHEYYREVQNA